MGYCTTDIVDVFGRVPVRLDEVNGMEYVVFLMFFGGNNRIRGAARTFRQHNGAARMVSQHGTLSDWSEIVG